MRITRRRLIECAGLCLAAGAAILGAEEAPAYHKRPPKGELPPTKDPGQFINRPLVQRVFELAGQIRPVLYQLPCYCSCDKFAGHGSLLDCFVDAHGEECAICQREAVYAFRQTKAKMTPAQIRAGIIKGEWRREDMRLATLKAL
jgi:hypothetical protein